ncbi:alpha-hydroxy acid oxidase [Rariglobus hedericola]|uniref:Alpha-hydroxy-acid oxidizing protein n=1 Tax=Rariglobus hedericola TaxID=2597822 RepID=A0A556QKL0_9BACT|nr:alpha-hydroxy acid oxidase [Rariglobus hedericola]TSJ77157.1 alpha-hydroxy-acid oxidizing protein [Rariglobus hedericola]
MQPLLTTIPADVVAVADYEALARERMTPEAWAYISGGGADELTLRWNREAFDRIRLRSRVLGGFTGGGHTRLSLFGRTCEHPILLAPVALHTLVHPDGERATVLGAAATQATMIVSTQAGVALEDVARGAEGAPLWFQLYIQPDRAFTEALVRRAEAAGYEALVVTVDAPVNGMRNREQRAQFRQPPGVEMVNLRGCRPAEMPAAGLCGGLMALAPTWSDLAWLRSLTRLPIILKGIMDAGDVARAIEAGVDGIVVSNHGGRTLDTLPATIEVLPLIVDAVGGRLPVLLDSGVRRGTDVLKAMALGATAVLVGRPYIYGLAAAGAPGVAHVVRILRAELEVAMALTGCATPADIDRSVLWE